MYTYTRQNHCCPHEYTGSWFKNTLRIALASPEAEINNILVFKISVTFDHFLSTLRIYDGQFLDKQVHSEYYTVSFGNHEKNNDYTRRGLTVQYFKKNSKYFENNFENFRISKSSNTTSKLWLGFSKSRILTSKLRLRNTLTLVMQKLTLL